MRIAKPAATRNRIVSPSSLSRARSSRHPRRKAASAAILAASMFGPLLRGEKVTLRPARENDAEHFVRWFADMEVTRYLATRMAITLQQELEFLKRVGESKDDVWWVIDVADQAIGDVDDPPHVEIGRAHV